MAEAVGISEAKVSHYLTGKYEMPSRFILGAAQYLHVSTDYLLGLTDDPKPPLSLSTQERTLIECSRTLSREQRELLSDIAALMRRQNQR